MAHFKRILLLVLIPFLAVGCSKTENHNVISGGQDSGGGDPRGSRASVVEAQFRDLDVLMEEVDMIIMSLSFFLTSNNPGSFSTYSAEEIKLFNKFYDLLIENGLGKLEDQEDQLQRTKNKIVNSGGKIVSYDSPIRGFLMRGMDERDHTLALSYAGYYDYEYEIDIHKEKAQAEKGIKTTPAPQYRSQGIQLKLSKQAPCKDRHNNSKTGSVKNLDPSNREICLSLSELQKVSESSLRRQIHALIIHEISHLVGFLEDDAQALQQFILDAYSEVFLVQSDSSFNIYEVIAMIAGAQNSIDLFYNLLDDEARVQLTNCKFKEKEATSLKSVARIMSVSKGQSSKIISAYSKHLVEKNLMHSETGKKIFNSLEDLDKAIYEINSIMGAFKYFVESESMCKQITHEDVFFMLERMDILRERLDFVLNSFSVNWREK